MVNEVGSDLGGWHAIALVILLFGPFIGVQVYGGLKVGKDLNQTRGHSILINY